MVVKTLFQHDGVLRTGEVEVRLLPGIPQLHVVGQPDSHIRECGIKLKSALRASDLAWPKGHQIVVNLRPSHFRKSSSGADLAIALGFLSLTGQLPAAVVSRVREGVVYGEVALDGKVFAPPDIGAALRGGMPLITGVCDGKFREGKWFELERLNSECVRTVERKFDWNSHWRSPELPDLELHPDAAEALVLASHMRLNILVGGPQGSGKTTWARALHSLTAKPDPREVMERQELFGDEVFVERWRPCENPHHSIPSLSMIGGGSPLVPGVITRAHGGTLIMDEFLQFHPSVLEALREPVECGYVEHARRGERARFPSRFQLIGTTNLCPCGKLYPGITRCGCALPRLRTVLGRLSGPVMDRFDLLLFSHTWVKPSDRVRLVEVQRRLKELADFRRYRGEQREVPPSWLREMDSGYRRQNSVLRLARGLADLEGSTRIRHKHFHAACARAIAPMEELRQLLA